MGAVRRIEIPAVGLDEGMQLQGSDPYGSRSHVGLRVPTRPTASNAAANGTPLWQNRYLFTACSFSLGERQVARILGYRQLVTIGVELAVVSGETTEGKRVVEQLVTSPFWHFPDGGVSFHITKFGPPNNQGAALTTPPPGPVPAGTSYKHARAPGLLWQSITLPAGNPFYTELTAYKPPNAGRPLGTVLHDGHQGSFTDLRTTWTTHGAWSALDLDVEGPSTITGSISVQQNVANGPLTAIPGFPPSPFYPAGLSAEEQFLLNFPTAQYFRVGLSLVVEIGDRRERPKIVTIGQDPSSEVEA